MAGDNEDVTFEDRWNLDETPEDATPADEEEIAKKKAELLKLAQATDIPVKELEQAPAERGIPEPPPPPMPPQIQPQTFFDKLMGVAAPKFLPGAPNAAPLPEFKPPVEPQVTPEAVQQLTEELNKMYGSKEAPPDISKLSTAGIREAGLTPGEESPAKEIEVLQRSGIKVPPKGAFSPEVEQALAEAAKASGMPVEFVRALAGIESGGNPESNKGKPTQYKGLFQIGSRGDKSEWARHGKGDIYNARDNAMGMVRLLLENKDRFTKAMGREPTPAELYLMHQQGLGFFTKGMLTNAAGNLPAGARTPENLTRAGFERWWTDRFNRQLASAAGVQGKPYLPMSEISPFLSGTPMAETKVPLERGTPDTSPSAGQFAALMTGTPLEQIKDITQKMNEAAVVGAAKGTKPMPIGKVKPSAEYAQPGTPLPQPYMPQRPDMLPMPSVSHTGVGGQGLIDQAANPSLMSTIMNEMALRGTPVVPPPKAGEQPVATPDKGSFLSRLTLPNPIEVFKDLIRQNDVSGPEALQNVKDVLAGAMQQPTGAFNATVAPAAGAIGLLTGSDTLKRFAEESKLRGDEYGQSVREFFGTKPGSSGEYVGQSLQPTAAGTLVNMGIGKAYEQAAPYISQFAKKYPIPSVVTPAHAATVFGEPPRVYNTPGGPVVMNDASLSEMVYGAGAMFGVGFLPAVAQRGARVATEWNPIRELMSPVRDVVGAPGTKAASTVGDLFTAATVDNVGAMFNAVDRLARMEKPPAGFMEIVQGRQIGIDPIAAASVKQRWRIQTNSGGQNLIEGAMKDGKMNVPAFKFDVDVSMGKLHEATQQLPDFAHYLKAKIIQEQLNINHALRTQLPSGAPRNQLQQLQNPPPRSYKDAAGQQWTKTYADAAVTTYENRPYGPQLKDLYQRYQENLAETRRFISDGQYNIENPISLDSKASERPSFPIFSERQNVKTIFDRIIDNDNPLSVAEDNMRFAMKKAMDTDAKRAFIAMAPKSAFTVRNQQWVDSRGQIPRRNKSLLTLTQDGAPMHWTADPMIATIMNSGDAPMANWGAFVSTPKSIFTATTTGKGMPPFSIIAAERAMQQGWVTAPKNIYRSSNSKMPILPAGPLSMLLSLPRQLGPQYAHDIITSHGFVARSFNNGVLRKMIPDAAHDVIIRTLEKAYANSWYKQMKDSGAFTGDTIMQSEGLHAKISKQKIQYNNTPMSPIIDFLHRSSDAALTFIKTNPYGRHVERARQAINDSAPYAFTYKMRKGATEVDPVTGGSRTLHPAEIAQIYRDYTGDPAIRGTPHGLAFQPGPGQKIGSEAALWAGKSIEPLKQLVPWQGVLIQSPRKTWQELAANPIRANMAYTMGNALPEMVAYLWNMQQGQEYVDYQMNGRGDYALTNKIYVAPWVRDRNNPPKPWEGVEVDWYQEGAPLRAIARGFMQQYYGRNSTNMYQDVTDALLGFLGTTFMPPIHPLANVGSVMVSGQPFPMKGLLGELFVSKPNPFDPASKESKLEKSIRQIAPGVADIFLAGKHAFEAGPDLWSKGTGGYQAAKHRVEQRTPIVRDVIGAKPPVSGSPVINEDLFKYDKMIKDLVKRYRTIEIGKGDIGLKSPGVSGGGMGRVGPLLPGAPPAEKQGKIPNPGISIAEPQNPLYKMWMAELEKTFIKDDPGKGSIGYRSMWKHYSIYSQALKRLAVVNEGNSAQWVREQESKPKTVEYLKRNHVNPYDFREVRDFYNNNRQQVGQVILNTMRATEQRINRDPRVRQLLGGKPFKMEMLDPKDTSLDTSD